MSESFTIGFYFFEEGDLGIPDVNWAGAGQDARDWGRAD